MKTRKKFLLRKLVQSTATLFLIFSAISSWASYSVQITNNLSWAQANPPNYAIFSWTAQDSPTTCSGSSSSGLANGQSATVGFSLFQGPLCNNQTFLLNYFPNVGVQVSITCHVSNNSVTCDQPTQSGSPWDAQPPLPNVQATFQGNQVSITLSN